MLTHSGDSDGSGGIFKKKQNLCWFQLSTHILKTKKSQ